MSPSSKIKLLHLLTVTMNKLTLLQLLTICVVSDAATKAFWQFGKMILCVQPNVNPLAYNNYGCYCGFGGSGTPVDELDKCCQTHDNCYGVVSKMDDCSSFFLPIYVRIYDYACTTKQVKCTDSNNKCQAALCECDRAAAHCFAQNEYKPEHKNLDSNACQ